MMPITVADFECLVKAQDLVSGAGDKTKLLKTLRTAEAVVRTHNLFLCHEAMVIKGGEGGDQVNHAIFEVLAATGLISAPTPTSPEQRRRRLTDLSAELYSLLLAKNTVRRMLTYAIAHTKTLV